MKLAVFAIAAVLGTACYAQAEPAPVYAGPPGGYVAGPVYGPAPMVAAPEANMQVNVDAVAVRQPAAPGPLRQALIQRFDHNGDGHLDVRERRQAIRALRRIARQLQRQNRREQRAMRLQRQVPPPRGNVDVDF